MANGVTFECIACLWHALAYVQTLEDAGIPKAQARAMAKAQKQALQDALDTKSFVTKADSAQFESALRSDFAKLEATTKVEIAGLRLEIHAMETRLTRWFIATTLTIIGVIVALSVGAATVLAPYLDILFRLGSLVKT